MADNLVDGESTVNPQATVVPYTKYVGVKEMLGKTERILQETQGRLGSLQAERDEAQGRLQTLEQELTALKTTAIDPAKYQELQTQHTNLVNGLTELRRQALIKEGVPVEKVQTLNMEQLNIFEEAYRIAGSKTQDKVADTTPKPDLGGGGGTPLPTSVHGALSQAFAVGEIKQVNNSKTT